MSNTIVEDIKLANGISVDNLGFDVELLIQIGAAKSELVQIGVTELDIDIDDAAVWPAFGNNTLRDLSKQYLILKTKIIFDPIPSDSISRVFQDYLLTLTGRIMHEIEEIENV